jgi:NAD(P)-dependent dehydrogenase (short-subunit alcohol dehydrogenase family)
MAGAAGASVVLAARTEEQIGAAAEEIRSAGGKALAVPTDITDAEASKALIARAAESFGSVDILVNNAGTNLIANLVLSKEEQWREVYELNVFAVFRLTREALRHMIRTKYGRIINISSVSEKVGAPYNSAYASSKAAINAFTRSIALETAKLGITVNSVCPWHVDTELLRFGMGKRGQIFGADAQEYIDKIAATSPQGRLVTAREVSSLAIYLMSEEASGITGQSMNVSGGAVVT